MKKIYKIICFAICIAIITTVFAACSPDVEEKTLTYNGTTLSAGQLGVEYSQSVATATGAEAVTYSLKTAGSLPAGLSLVFGTITGTPEVPTDGAQKFIVVAKANGFADVEAEFSITIAPGVISYTGKQLETAWVGEEYTQPVDSATGPVASSIAYSLKTAGSLPDGLELVNGKITGTPTEETDGEIEFTVVAKATNYTDVEAKFSMSVASADKLTYVGGTLSAGLVGGFYSQDIATAVGFGDIDISYELKPGAPAWLSLESGRVFGTPETEYLRDEYGNFVLDPIHGEKIEVATPLTVVATGTPATAGTYTFTVIAQADGFADTEAEFLITVTAPVLKEYMFEAMYVDMEEMHGAHISGAPNGKNMLVEAGQAEGEFPSEKALCKYFIAYTHGVGFSVEFVVWADRDTTATLKMSLAHEWETDAQMYYDPDKTIEGSFGPISKPGIKLEANGKVVNYDAFTLKGRGDGPISFGTHEFGEIQLVEGMNIISLSVMANELWPGRSAGGPMIDCMMLETLAGLIWNPHLSNLVDLG